MDIHKYQSDLAHFAAERDWEQYHSPKNLAMALVGEAGELLAQFQWLSDTEARNIALDSARLARIREEAADVFLYLLRLADVLAIDLEQSVHDKMLLNAKRYPVSMAKGNATKYSERE